jgi:hypothetical protein
MAFLLMEYKIQCTYYTGMIVVFDSSLLSTEIILIVSPMVYGIRDSNYKLKNHQNTK